MPIERRFPRRLLNERTLLGSGVHTHKRGQRHGRRPNCRPCARRYQCWWPFPFFSSWRIRVTCGKMKYFSTIYTYGINAATDAYTHANRQTHTYAWTHILNYTPPHTHKLKHTQTHKRTYAHKYVHTYAYTCTNMYTFIHIYKYIYLHMGVYIYIYSYV